MEGNVENLMDQTVQDIVGDIPIELEDPFNPAPVNIDPNIQSVQTNPAGQIIDPNIQAVQGIDPNIQAIQGVQANQPDPAGQLVHAGQPSQVIPDSPIGPVIDPTMQGVQGVVDPAVDPAVQVDSSFVPESEVVLTEISPANFDNMTKILAVLSKENDDTIMIRNSIITQNSVDNIIQADMSQIFKNKKGELVSLDIINPKKYVTLFTQFSGNNNIFIISDDENSRFIVTNGEIKLFLPKQDSMVQQSIESFVLSEKRENVANFTIEKNERKIIKNLSKGSDYIEYLVKDNKVKGIHIPDIAIYIFPEYKKEPGIQNLNENNSDLSLRLNNFLPIEAEQYNTSIIKDGDRYLSITDCIVGGKIKINAIESIDISEQGNLIF